MLSSALVLVHATTGTGGGHSESSRTRNMQGAANTMPTALAILALYLTRVLLHGGSLRDSVREVFEAHDCTCVHVADPAVAPICCAIMAPCMFQREVDNVTCKRW